MLEHELSSLKNLQPCEFLHSLEKSVKIIKSKVNVLRSHELVRNHDIIALHNLRGIRLAKLKKNKTGKLISRIEDIIENANSMTNQVEYIDTFEIDYRIFG